MASKPTLHSVQRRFVANEFAVALDLCPKLPFAVWGPGGKVTGGKVVAKAGQHLIAHCVTRAVADALAAALDGIQVAVWVEGGVVQGGRSTCADVEIEIFDGDDLRCGENDEGAAEAAEKRYRSRPHAVY